MFYYVTYWQVPEQFLEYMKLQRIQPNEVPPPYVVDAMNDVKISSP